MSCLTIYYLKKKDDFKEMKKKTNISKQLKLWAQSSLTSDIVYLLFIFYFLFLEKDKYYYIIKEEIYILDSQKIKHAFESWEISYQYIGCLPHIDIYP